MTNSAGQQAAPAPTTLHLDQLRAAQAEKPVSGDVVAHQQHIAVGRKAFDVVPSLTPLDLAEITEAQESGDLKRIIASFGRLIRKSQRQEFIDYILADPDDDGDRVAFADLQHQVEAHTERLMARPTNR